MGTKVSHSETPQLNKYIRQQGRDTPIEKVNPKSLISLISLTDLEDEPDERRGGRGGEQVRGEGVPQPEDVADDEDVGDVGHGGQVEVGRVQVQFGLDGLLVVVLD